MITKLKLGIFKTQFFSEGHFSMPMMFYSIDSYLGEMNATLINLYSPHLLW